MARVSTYLNFPRATEEAFSFYRAVFRSEFSRPIARFKDIPPHPGQPPLADADKNLVMHVELPILGGHVLMGTDSPESMGFTLTRGNNITINLEPDTRAETERLFTALAEGGKVEMPLQDMFWGAYFGLLVDRFGTRWMFNCVNKT
jgi:PhnB protein